jgi:MerR family transcriptional regulator, thiopeptide resistance regulator
MASADDPDRQLAVGDPDQQLTAGDPDRQLTAGDPDRQLAVGDLARATGLTVRTLHHYDRLGLLSPGRDAGGRRRYGPAEIRRLHQIVALRGFGLPLAEIAQLLAGGGPDPMRLLRRQLEQAEERIAAAQRLRQSLLAVIARLASLDGEVTVSQLTELIERMITMDGKLTREQLDQMTEQRRRMTASLTPGQLAKLQRAEQVSRLTPEQLAEMQRPRRQLLPDDFPCDEARLAILQSQPETRVRRVF